MGAAVVSGVDAAPIFESPGHVFDFVALLVEDGVIGDRDLPIGFRRDAGGDDALFASIVAFIFAMMLVPFCATSAPRRFRRRLLIEQLAVASGIAYSRAIPKKMCYNKFL